MAEQFYSILTSIGKAKIANANVLGTKLNLTTLVLGDGNGKYYNPTENQEAIVNEVWKGNISSITTDSKNPNWIVIETIIAGNVGGFFIREVGILDDEGSLIAIGKYPETYKPVISDGSTKDLIIRMILEVSNSANVTLKIDPAIIMATKKDVEVLDNKIKNIKVPVTKVNNKLGDVTLKAEDIKANNDKTIEESLQEVTSQMAEFAKKEELSKTTGGSSGSKSIGVSTISGLTGNDVQTCLQNLFQFADNGRKNIATVIGSPLTSSDTFDSMKSKLQIMKNTFASNLMAKGQSSNGSESLNSLIGKVSMLKPSKAEWKVVTLPETSVQLSPDSGRWNDIEKSLYITIPETSAYIFKGTLRVHATSGYSNHTGKFDGYLIGDNGYVVASAPRFDGDHNSSSTDTSFSSVFILGDKSISCKHAYTYSSKDTYNYAFNENRTSDKIKIGSLKLKLEGWREGYSITGEAIVSGVIMYIPYD